MPSRRVTDHNNRTILQGFIFMFASHRYRYLLFIGMFQKPFREGHFFFKSTQQGLDLMDVLKFRFFEKMGQPLQRKLETFDLCQYLRVLKRHQSQSDLLRQGRKDQGYTIYKIFRLFLIMRRNKGLGNSG